MVPSFGSGKLYNRFARYFALLFPPLLSGHFFPTLQSPSGTRAAQFTRDVPESVATAKLFVADVVC